MGKNIQGFLLCISGVCLWIISIQHSTAEELLIGFPALLPPWTLQERDTGIAVEVARTALSVKGHTIKTIYLPLTRLNQDIGEKLDGHAMVEKRALSGLYSKKIMDFQTSLISLKDNQLKINSINDLERQPIVAFQNASILFGDEFQRMTTANPNYVEMFKQENQVALLYKGRANVILLDKNIFLYFRRITILADTSAPVTYHQVKGLTETSPAYVVFKDELIRDAFNTGLQEIRNSGKYKKIFKKYIR